MQFRPHEQYEALQQARAKQNDEAFKRRYRSRLGIEGTISQAVRAFELRKTRYLGLAKTHSTSHRFGRGHQSMPVLGLFMRHRSRSNQEVWPLRP